MPLGNRSPQPIHASLSACTSTTRLEMLSLPDGAVPNPPATGEGMPGVEGRFGRSFSIQQVSGPKLLQSYKAQPPRSPSWLCKNTITYDTRHGRIDVRMGLEENPPGLSQEHELIS